MRIEISKPSKTALTEDDIYYIRCMADYCINTYCLMSEQNNRSLFVFECVPEGCAKELVSCMEGMYNVNLKEDTFMAEIDLMDFLSRGLW